MRSKVLGWVLGLSAVAVALAVVSTLRADGTAAAKDRCYFLVARDDMPDPMFQQTVILMVPTMPENPVIAGLIVNKPTAVTLAQVLGRLPGLQHPTAKLYYGGPVDDDEPVLLVRGPHPHKGTTRLMDNLYTNESAEAITDLLVHPWSPRDTRLLMGRAQWTRDQLRMEILRGAWDAMPADVDLIFKDDPAAVWRGLQKHSHLREVDFGTADAGASRDDRWPFAIDRLSQAFATF